MFPPLNIPFEQWIGHVTFGLPYDMFRFTNRIFYKGFPGLALIVFVVFGVLEPLASFMLVHFVETKFEMIACM